MQNLISLEIGQPIFWTRKNMFVYYIAFWPELNRIVYSYNLFSLRKYDDIPYTVFYNEFLTNKDEIEYYLKNKIENEKENCMISIPERVERKMELLQIQQECMKKLGKPSEDLKKGNRNIKRQKKKILNYLERNEQIKREIDSKYIGIWEQFENLFGS